MNDGRGKTRTEPKAVVIGGSMAGLFAALLLRRAGWQVDVYERIGAELAGRGASIVTHRQLFDVLAKAGIDTAAAALGVSVPGRRVLDRDGRVAGELALPQVLTSWGRLYGMLKDAIPANCYHHGQNLLEVTEHSDRVVARFANGTRASGDLLIGADGIFSTVRAQCAPHVRPVYAGYVAWRGLVNEQDAAGSRRTMRLVCLQLAARRADARLSRCRSQRRDGRRSAPIQFRMVPHRRCRSSFG